MAESDRDRKKRIKEIGELIGEAIILSVSEKRPGSGQDDLSDEEKAKLRARVGDAFAEFLDFREWKAKTDEEIHKFLAAILPKILKQRADGKCIFDEAIKEVFPSLDIQFEGHAIMNLMAHLVSAGQFHKVKPDIQIKIVEEMYNTIGIVISYLHWRTTTTLAGTPPKEEQH